MIQKYLLSLLRMLGLIFILTLERVVGLPWISTLLVLVWLDKEREEVYKFPALLFIFSLLLSVVYNLSLPLAFLWWLGLSLLINVSEAVVSDKKRRFFIASLLGNLILVWWLQLRVGYLTAAQFVVSYFVTLFWMRVLKFDKVINT